MKRMNAETDTNTQQMAQAGAKARAAAAVLSRAAAPTRDAALRAGLWRSRAGPCRARPRWRATG